MLRTEFGLAVPIAIRIDDQNFGMVGQTIYHCSNAGSTGKDRIPIAERQVCYQYDWTDVLAAIGDGKEQIRSAAIKGQMTYFIDNEQLSSGISG